MSAQVQIINVEIENKGKYQMAEVAYKDLGNGKTASKKLVSFKNPRVWAAIKDAAKGDVLNFTLQKNDNGFWEWADLADSGEQPTKTQGKTTAAPAAKSTYETPEERARRQVLIVRQSSLTNAVETLKMDKKAVDPDEALRLAEVYFAWVFAEPQLPGGNELPNMPDDVPY